MASTTMRVRPAAYDGFDYERFWRGRARRHLDRLEHRLVAELLPANGARIVDLGCGFGRLHDVYRGRFDQAVLVDASWSQLLQARDRCPDATLVAAGIGSLPFRDFAFDWAVMVRVLHHLEGPARALADVGRILAPGGHAVLSASNKRNAARVLRFLLGRDVPNPFQSGPVRYGPCSFGLTRRDLASMLAAAGLSVERWRGAGVLDKLAGRLRAAGTAIPPGVALSRAFGRFAVAPILFCSAVRSGEVDEGDRAAGAGIDPVSPFACPVCRDSLKPVRTGFDCEPCGRRYPRVDGILDFRI